ncbi:MAG: hypothetical protein WBF33_10340 [Candidatus Nitrosopolaris sp.]
MAKRAEKKEMQNIPDAGLLSKNHSWMDFIKKESLLANPGRTEWRQRLIHSMLHWAQNDNALEIMQFCIEYKISYFTLKKEWVDKYKDIREAYDYVKMMIACNRRTGSMMKRLDGSYAYKDMHLYDPEWHAVNKYHNDMKVEQEKQAHTFIINDSKPKVLSKEEMKGEKDE